MLDLNTPITTFQVVTMVLALIGSVLGILNLWINARSKRLRLRVTPAWGLFNAGPTMLMVELINLSEFPLCIIEVGIRMGDKTRAPILHWSHTKLPIHIQPRMQANLVYPVLGLTEIFAKRPIGIYARTACGQTINGRSKAFNQMVQRTLTNGTPEFE